MARKKAEVKQDLFAFMSILVMTIGALVMLLVSNTLIIVSNPENTQITSIITSSLYVEEGTGTEGDAPFPQGNKLKEPAYIDVHRDRIIIYSNHDELEDGAGEKSSKGIVVPIRELERPGTAFEQLLDLVYDRRQDEYIILLVRPRSAQVAAHMRNVIKDRNIDMGFELFEEGRPIPYEARRVQKPIQ